MPRPALNFDIDVEETSDDDLLPFTLTFTKKVIDAANPDDNGKETHSFLANVATGARGQLALAKMVRFTDSGQRQYDLNAMMAFFREVLDDDNFSRLETVIERRDLNIKMEKLGEVFTRIVQEVNGGVPTERPVGSADGPPATGDTSTAATLASA